MLCGNFLRYLLANSQASKQSSVRPRADQARNGTSLVNWEESFIDYVIFATGLPLNYFSFSLCYVIDFFTNWLRPGQRDKALWFSCREPWHFCLGNNAFSTYY